MAICDYDSDLRELTDIFLLASTFDAVLQHVDRILACEKLVMYQGEKYRGLLDLSLAALDASIDRHRSRIKRAKELWQKVSDYDNSRYVVTDKHLNPDTWEQVNP